MVEVGFGEIWEEVSDGVVDFGSVAWRWVEKDVYVVLTPAYDNGDVVEATCVD